jgi:predicted DNA-binding transcriptional regulator AlpA
MFADVDMVRPTARAGNFHGAPINRSRTAPYGCGQARFAFLWSAHYGKARSLGVSSGAVRRSNPTEHTAMLRNIRSGIDRRRVRPVSDPILIRLPEVLAICALSRSCVYEGVKNGTFPSPVKLNGRPSAWIKQEVQQWVAQRIEASRSDEARVDTHRRHQRRD